MESTTPRPSRAAEAPKLGGLARLTHLGVDPEKPRSETKHVVLTNQYALYISTVTTLSVAGAEGNGLLPEVRFLLAIALPLILLTLGLNALGRPTLATSWLLALFLATMGRVAMLEELATEHVGFLILNATVPWFLFPPERRALIWLFTIVSGVAAIALPFWLEAHPAPPPLPAFDVRGIALGNQVMLLVTLVFFASRAVAEITRAERALVDERKKTETLLKREVAHQVAERSREMGAALARDGAPVTPAALASRFGARYQVVRTLGEGGMGAVFEVERKTDGARLALKVMTGDVSREHAARFAREAEIGARIHDPHLVEIVDVGVAEGGAPFLVMELVLGGSLDSQRARFGDAAWALPLLRDVLAGLSALHAAGVVHRDLKPANVLLTRDGRAKVSDFGIARQGALGSVDVSAPTAVGALPGLDALTGTGAWIGTPLYMAPESAKGGREAQAPSDVFAFGLLAYEVLSKARPFPTAPVLLALADQPLPPPPPLDVPGLPLAARDAIRAALSADPKARPTVEALRSALG